MLTHFMLNQPLSVDNALYTSQIIHKLIKQMNTVIDEINSIDSRANQYTDEQISALYSRLKENEFQAIEDNIQLLHTLINNTNTEIVSLTQEIYRLYELLDSKIDNVKIDLNSEIRKVKIQLEEFVAEIEKVLKEGGGYAPNPMNGSFETVSKAMLDTVNNSGLKSMMPFNMLSYIKNGTLWEVFKYYGRWTSDGSSVTINDGVDVSELMTMGFLMSGIGFPSYNGILNPKAASSIINPDTGTLSVNQPNWLGNGSIVDMPIVENMLQLKALPYAAFFAMVKKCLRGAAEEGFALIEGEDNTLLLNFAWMDIPFRVSMLGDAITDYMFKSLVKEVYEYDVVEGVYNVQSELPDVSELDEGKVMMVINGNWGKGYILPIVTSGDDGSFLRVKDGIWSKEILQIAEEEEF